VFIRFHRLLRQSGSLISRGTFEDTTFGLRPAAWSRANDLLGPNVLLIGGAAATPDELRLLAATGTPLAHSPVANMKMATGNFPLPDALAAGVLVDLHRAHTLPVHDVISNLVFAANGSNVDTVLVGGRVVLRSGTLTGGAEPAILAAAMDAGARLRTRLQLPAANVWPIE
jgi:cytosine/adenosine deaminase-related metal-dependent hydrolase